MQVKPQPPPPHPNNPDYVARVQFRREPSTMEVQMVSAPVFMRLIPHNVKSQEMRVCVCTYCKRAKLMAQSLLANWPALHGGGNGGGCSCECEICADGACENLLPWKNAKAVHGMDDLADSLLCSMVPVFRSHTKSGEDVYMHRDECVKGTCMKCKGSKFFDYCPRHRQRDEDNANGDPSPTCAWKTFGPVTNDSDHPSKSSRRDDANAEDYVPRAPSKKQPRLVRKREVFYKQKQ